MAKPIQYCKVKKKKKEKRKGRGTRDQIANTHWIIEKQQSSRKTSTSALLTTPKPLTVWITTDCVDFNKLWKIVQEMRIPDHLTCLLRNLYAGQEATVRTGHGTTDWFQIDAIQPSHPLSSLSPPAFSLSQHQGLFK